MKKTLLLLGVLSLIPLMVQADVSLDINVPGVSLHLGDQDKRGYYWDGYDWRPPQWWHDHHNGGMSTVVVILVIAMSVVIIGMVAVGSAHQHKTVIIHSEGRGMGTLVIMTVALMVISHNIMEITDMANKEIIMGRVAVASPEVKITKVAKIIMAVMAASRSTHRKIMATVVNK